jgi:hypothetical protein
MCSVKEPDPRFSSDPEIHERRALKIHSKSCSLSRGNSEGVTLLHEESFPMLRVARFHPSRTIHLS